MAIIASDDHTGIEGQEFESKQPCLYKGADDYVALLTRPVQHTFPRPEGPGRTDSTFCRAQWNATPRCDLSIWV